MHERLEVIHYGTPQRSTPPRLRSRIRSRKGHTTTESQRYVGETVMLERRSLEANAWPENDRSARGSRRAATREGKKVPDHFQLFAFQYFVF